MSTYSYLKEYLEFATEKESEYINGILDTGSISGAAKSLGRDRKTIQEAINRVKDRAAKRGFSPEHNMTNTVPESFGIDKITINYDSQNNVNQQWVRAKVDPAKQKIIMEEARAAFVDTIPRDKISAPLSKKQAAEIDPDKLNLYVITDYHIGMNSWWEETGENWDISIAENLLYAWFKEAVLRTPNAKVGVIGQLGDFLHWDGLLPLTPASRHVVDADTRYRLIVRVAIRVLRRVIALLLQKHEHVHLICAEGNHDESSSIVLSECFGAFYEDDPRVTVDLTGDIYYCYEWGKTSLFFHHGHRKKVTNVHDVFAAKFREVFGRTKYSYGHIGHLHHAEMKETNLMKVEQHRTLAAKDAYASRGGYLSDREAVAITYSRECGYAGTIAITPEMLDFKTAKSMQAA